MVSTSRGAAHTTRTQKPPRLRLTRRKTNSKPKHLSDSEKCFESTCVTRQTRRQATPPVFIFLDLVLTHRRRKGGKMALASSTLSLTAPRALLGSEHRRSWRVASSSRSDGAGCVILHLSRSHHATHTFFVQPESRAPPTVGSFLVFRKRCLSLTMKRNLSLSPPQAHTAARPRHLLPAAAPRGGGPRRHAAAVGPRRRGLRELVLTILGR